MTAKPPRFAPCSFAQLVHQVIVMEEKASLAEVATDMGMSYAALHSRIIGRTPFRATEIRRLIEIVTDPRLIRFFIDGRRFVLAARPDPMLDPSASIRIAVAHATQEVVDLFRIVVASLEVGTELTHRDRATILKELLDTESALAGVRQALQ
ncbi:MAG TPA: phage regulatory CII family protein [Allosphingosinicella sp.]|nr:phage regulatory CII family protein [Allosphingosinicella sp.]